MFDPHGTRKTNKKYFTRKGQVIQAKRTNRTNDVVIEPMLVDKYKKYILDNNLIKKQVVPVPVKVYPKIIGIFNTINNVEALFTDSEIPWTHPRPEEQIAVQPNHIFYLIGVSLTEIYVHIGSTVGEQNQYITSIPSGFGVKTYVVLQTTHATVGSAVALQNMGLVIQFPDESTTIKGISGYAEVNSTMTGEDKDYSLLIKRSVIDILV